MTNGEPVQFATYIIAFHDVLNQGEDLLLWDDLDKLVSGDPAVGAALRRTVASVSLIRDDFAGLKAGLNAGNAAQDEIPQDLLDDQEFMNKVERMRKGEVFSQAFSDTNIWYCPLRDPVGTFFVRTAYHLVAGTAFAHLLALSRSTPCRGAITVGVGTNALGNEIYGPCLVKACRLEARVADYSRVVVGFDLLEYLAGMLPSVDERKCDTSESRIRRYHEEFINHIKEMTFLDDDGAIALDFAGPKAARIFGGLLRAHGEDPAAIFSRAMGFARSSQEEFVKSRDHKLAARYDKLYRYLQQRSEYWHPQ